MRGFRMGAALALAAASLGLGQIPSDVVTRGHARPHVRRAWGMSRTTLHLRNGTRECARRRRQIEAGSLRVENGLVT